MGQNSRQRTGWLITTSIRDLSSYKLRLLFVMDSPLYLGDVEVENNSSDGAEDIKQYGTTYVSQTRRLSWFQITWIVISLMLHLVLITLSLSKFLSTKTDKVALYFATHFAENQDLVSLDRKYDFLWEELVPPGINLFNTPNSDEWEKGDYSM